MTQLLTDESSSEITITLVQKKDDWQAGSAQSTLDGLGKVNDTPAASETCGVSYDADNETEVFTFSGESENLSGQDYFSATNNAVSIIHKTNEARLWDYVTYNGKASERAMNQFLADVKTSLENDGIEGITRIKVSLTLNSNGNSSIKYILDGLYVIDGKTGKNKASGPFNDLIDLDKSASKIYTANYSGRHTNTNYAYWYLPNFE